MVGTSKWLVGDGHFAAREAARILHRILTGGKP
jgi:hypothetical protein